MMYIPEEYNRNYLTLAKQALEVIYWNLCEKNHLRNNYSKSSKISSALEIFTYFNTRLHKNYLYR